MSYRVISAMRNLAAPLASFQAFTLFLLLLAFVFVGDYAIGAVHMSYVLGLLLGIIGVFSDRTGPVVVVESSLLMPLLVTIGGLTLLQVNGNFSPYYASAFLSFAVAIPAASYLCRTQRILFESRLAMLTGLAVQISFTLGMVLTPGRAFIFGPNVLYRLIGFLAFHRIIYRARRPGGVSTVSVLLELVLASVGLAATLSRGGAVVLASYTVLILSVQDRWGRILTVGIVVVIGAAMVSIVQDFDLWQSLERFITFADSVGSNSIGDRTEIVSAVLSGEALTFAGIGDRGFQRAYPFIRYPHNQMIEFLVYQGIFGALIVLMVLSSIFRFRKHRYRRNNPLLVALVPALLGTLVSGSLFDNYAVYAIYVAAFAREWLALAQPRFDATSHGDVAKQASGS